MPPSDRDRRALPAALLRWYDADRRDLPWRRAPSAYATLVSEFMLQQTVVAAVIPHFHRFMARFPDLAALAGAAEEEVLAQWSGLGYYSRARNLHRAAREAHVAHGGLPATEEGLRALPGIGPYTAAAIAAIAFGVRTFALDGNAVRVVARLFADEGAIDKPAVRTRLREAGTTLVPADRPGDFAQAVMELGARVCVPRRPRCDECPIARHCAAREAGIEARLPTRSPRRQKRVLSVACAAIERRGRLLLVRRPAGTLLGGTWTLPAAEAGTDGEAAACRAAVRELGLEPTGDGEPAGQVRHVFTHRDVTAHVYRQPAAGTVAPILEARWVGREELAALALSSFTRKTLALVW